MNDNVAEPFRAALEQWRKLVPGARVRVTGKGPNDHVMKGRTGTFLEYTQNGFARVALDPLPDYRERNPLENRWLLHPESLEVIL